MQEQFFDSVFESIQFSPRDRGLARHAKAHMAASTSRSRQGASNASGAHPHMRASASAFPVVIVPPGGASQISRRSASNIWLNARLLQDFRLQKPFSRALPTIQARSASKQAPGDSFVAPNLVGIKLFDKLAVPSSPGMHHLRTARTVMSAYITLFVKVK